MFGLLLLACRPINPTPVDTEPFHDGEPTITGISYRCDPDEESWRFRLSTDGWTGGARLWMARELETVELHSIRSTEAAGNGAWDCLDLELVQVADWRDATSGTSTRWRCSDLSTLSFLVWVDNPRAEAKTDCRAWGASPDLWEQSDDIDACGTIIDLGATAEPVDTADTAAPEPALSAGEVVGCG